MNSAVIATLSDDLSKTFLLSLGSFILAMMLTPIYTHFAYKYHFWKKQRTTTTTGEKLSVFNKLHADKFKRNIPTMAGMIFVAAITIITFFFDLDRGQTWLPLAALVGGAGVGLLDDIINVRGNGSGVAGLRSSLKFAMVTAIGLFLGWWFFTRITGASAIHIPFLQCFHNTFNPLIH
jgi:phospho-N-acetylmuramoyl-pentapeptide-transferase